MTFATDMNEVATELLTEFDERTGDDRLAILKQGDVVWNPVTAENEIAPDTKYFLTGTQQNDLSGMIDGSTVQQGDMMLTVSTLITDESGAIVEYIPQVEDKVLIDGIQWSIVDTPHSNYTGDNLIIAYKIQVRK